MAELPQWNELHVRPVSDGGHGGGHPSLELRAEPLPPDRLDIHYVLSGAHRPVSVEFIAELAQEDGLTAPSGIEEWYQFLHRKDTVEAAGVSPRGIGRPSVETLWRETYEMTAESAERTVGIRARMAATSAEQRDYVRNHLPEMLLQESLLHDLLRASGPCRCRGTARRAGVGPARTG